MEEYYDIPGELEIITYSLAKSQESISYQWTLRMIWSVKLLKRF